MSNPLGSHQQVKRSLGRTPGALNYGWDKWGYFRWNVWVNTKVHIHFFLLRLWEFVDKSAIHLYRTNAQHNIPLSEYEYILYLAILETLLSHTNHWAYFSCYFIIPIVPSIVFSPPLFIVIISILHAYLLFFIYCFLMSLITIAVEQCNLPVVGLINEYLLSSYPK